MSRITIDFKGGPYDGPNDVKDTGAPIEVRIPHGGRMAVYFQAKDGESAIFKGFADGLDKPKEAHHV